MYFELAGTSNYQSSNYRGPTVTGIRIYEVKSVVRDSKGNEYYFELAGTSNYQGPTVLYFMLLTDSW